MSRRGKATSLVNRAALCVYRRLGRRAFVLLALLVSALVLIDFGYTHLMGAMERKTFDLIMRYRYQPRAPDPDLVIVDIDEKSLAAMAKDYGRWPWPREVLAELVEGLERQRPAAIVFDILFSDADVANPQSDDYFDRAMRATKNTYFPYLRLDPKNDHLSEVTPAMLLGAVRRSDAQEQEAGIAVVLPRFPALIESGRLGLHNVEPDRDSVIRTFRPWHEAHGWRLPSLPLALARDQGWTPPVEDQFLINWRGAPFSFRYASFSDVYADQLRKEKQRPADEFTGKIVLIGSTAPSLFDIKATSMASIHPGVEILATVIDNLKRGDYYRESSRALYALASLAFVWGLAWAYLRRVRPNLLNGGFAVLQGLLIAISYLSLTLTTHYVDLSAPIGFGLLYFSAANLYTAMSERMLTQQALFVEKLVPERSYALTLVALQATSGEPKVLRRFRAEVDRAVAASRAGGCRVARMMDGGGALESLFGDIALVYWLCPSDERERALDQVNEAKRLCVELAGQSAAMPLRTSLQSGIAKAGPRGLLGDEARRLLLVALAGLEEGA